MLWMHICRAVFKKSNIQTAFKKGNSNLEEQYNLIWQFKWTIGTGEQNLVKILQINLLWKKIIVSLQGKSVRSYKWGNKNDMSHWKKLKFSALVQNCLSDSFGQKNVKLARRSLLLHTHNALLLLLFVIFHTSSPEKILEILLSCKTCLWRKL